MYFVRFDESGAQVSWCKAANKKPGLLYYEAPGGFVPELYKCFLEGDVVNYKFIPNEPKSIPSVMENEIKREFGMTIIDEFGGENTEMVKAGIIVASDINALLSFFGTIQLSVMGGALTTAREQIKYFYSQNQNYSWLTEERKDKYVDKINTFLGEL